VKSVVLSVFILMAFFPENSVHYTLDGCCSCCPVIHNRVLKWQSL